MNPEFIKQQVQRIQGKKLVSSSRIFILCPWHKETLPSGSVSLNTSYPKYFGTFHCWGCGKKATWNDLAEQLGLAKLSGKQAIPKYAPSIDMKGVKDKLLPGAETIQEFDFFDIQKPKWRGFNKEFLEGVGAKLAYHDKSERFYMWFPVMANGTEVGYFRAQMEKPPDGIPSYLNKPGEWVKRKGLFPLDYAVKLMKKKELKTLVLVEGPRDALRLLRDGIPAVAILGTQNWTSNKRHIIESTNVERIIIMMDGDLPNKQGRIPGKEAAKAIAPELSKFMEVKIVPLWKIGERLEKKIDPCNAPQSIINNLKRHLI